MSNKIDALLSRIEDPSLRAQVAAELSAAQSRRKFGLVFENHLPETVRLPRVKPRRGVKVAIKGAPTGREDLLYIKRMRGIGADRVAECVPAHVEEGETPVLTTHSAADLVVVAEFGDPIYPGLTRVGEVSGPGTNPEAPAHIVLNAENHHALQALQWSHAGGVDLIYIDPPYNTGNKTWQYNDHYVAEKDTFRHSKWLSFMEKRLILARTLLKDTGVIIVAIGDEEHHRLRMLMDQVFGEQNFLANITWQGSTKSDSRFGGAGVDYMLAYGKSINSLVASDVRWKDKKKGYAAVVEAADRSWQESGHDPEVATTNYRQWFRQAKPDVDGGTKMFNSIDHTGRLYRGDNTGSPSWRPNLQYEVLHPSTGLPCKMPKNGWQFSKEVMAERIAAGMILFGKDETTVPQRKRYFEGVDTTEPKMIFDQTRSSGSKHLAAVLGDKRFPFPKDHNVLMRWFRMVAPKDAVILDFFGGSGTTAEAVLRLNAEDGGTRQSILVTNNELAAKDDAALRKAGHEPGSAEHEAKGVFHHVTKPRIETVVTGRRTDDSAYSDGLPGRVEFFDLEYLDADRIADDRAFEAVLPMLWMRAGSLGQTAAISPEAPWYISGNFAVLRDSTQSDAFAEALPADVTNAYIVTNSASEFARAIEPLSEELETIRLYEKYLTTFEINTLERA